MIAFRSVAARAGRKSRAFLRDVTFEVQEGVFAVLGTPADGTSLLLDVASGAVPVERGEVSVFGGPPALARSRVACVPRAPSLPPALTVEEVVALEANLRGGPSRPASERLDVLGIASLARRRTGSLSVGEARAVVLALAVTSSARLLLVDEPLVSLAPPASLRAIEALRAAAAAGTCIVLATSSVRDATRLGDRLAVLTAHTLAPLTAAYAHAGPTGARLRVVVASAEDATRLSVALRDEPAVVAIETAAFAAPEEPRVGLLASGPRLLDVAAALGRAASRAGVDLDVIETAVMPLETVAASLSSAQHAWMAPVSPPAPSAPSAPPPTSPSTPPAPPPSSPPAAPPSGGAP